MKTLAIIQARMGSTRFPGKVMQPILGTPMIELLLGRLSQSKLIDRIIVATSQDNRNQPLVDCVRALGYDIYQGSEEDVLDRYYQIAAVYQPQTVVRITGDCPLIDPEVVDQAISMFHNSNIDYLSNINPPTYPNGLDVEVFSFNALAQAWQEACQPPER